MESPKKFSTLKSIPQIPNLGDQKIVPDNLKQVFDYFSSKEILTLRLINKDYSFFFPVSCFINKRIKESFSETVIHLIGLERLSDSIFKPFLNVESFCGLDEDKQFDLNNWVYNRTEPTSREYESLKNILKNRRMAFGKKSNGGLFLCFHYKRFIKKKFIVMKSHSGLFEPWNQPLFQKMLSTNGCLYNVYINTDTSLEKNPRNCIRKASLNVQWENGDRIELTKDLFYHVIFGQLESEVFPSNSK